MSKSRVLSSKPAKVIVIGSLNIDQVCRVDELPRPGETVQAVDYNHYRGGKGANQAIAARRQEVEVAMIGAVGDDENGRSYLRYLEKSEEIDVSGISLSPYSTGAAFITVEEGTGENTIVVAGGANESLSRSEVSSRRSLIESGTALLAQFEVPSLSILEGIKLAEAADVPVIVNPSPFVPSFPWDDVSVDYVIVNETESADLLEFPVDINELSLIRQRIHELRIRNLIITRGSESTLIYTVEGEHFSVGTLPVLPLDTVGSGDAFAGCFAARIAGGGSLEDAVRAANCAGALATLGGGAQNPIPDREKVNQHLEQIPRR